MKKFQLVIEDERAERLKEYFNVKSDGQLRGKIQEFVDKAIDKVLPTIYSLKERK